MTYEQAYAFPNIGMWDVEADRADHAVKRRTRRHTNVPSRFEIDLTNAPPPGGVCNQGDPNAMFPEYRGDGTISSEAEAAKRVCARCPIRLACLDYALEHNERWGIWGGLDHLERRKLRTA